MSRRPFKQFTDDELAALAEGLVITKQISELPARSAKGDAIARGFHRIRKPLIAECDSRDVEVPTMVRAGS